MTTRCAKNEELSDQLSAILAKLVDLTSAQLNAFRNNQMAELMRLDQELENTIGQKERAIGALREHRKEHGC